MTQKRALLCVVIGALLGAFFVSPSPAWAKPTYDIDFSAPDADYSFIYGQLSESAGNPAPGAVDYGGPNAIDINVSIPVSCSPGYQVSVAFDRIFSGSFTPPAYPRRWVYVTENGSSVKIGDNQDSSAGTWNRFTYTYTPTQTVTAVRVYIGWNPLPGGSAALDNIHIECGTEAPEYDSTPAIGATIDLGVAPVGNTVTNAQALRITNVGELLLTINSITITGDHAAAFSVSTILGTSFDLLPDAYEDVSISCTPAVIGPFTATLTVSNTDADEGTATYTLQCSGQLGEGGFAYPVATIERPPSYTSLYPVDPPYYAIDAARIDWRTPYTFPDGSYGQLAFFSQSTTNWVHSAYPGAVTAVEAIADISGAAYSPLGDEKGTDYCTFYHGPKSLIFAGWPDPQNTCEMSLQGITSSDRVALFASRQGGYRITVTLEDDRELRYIVSAPQVSVGDSVGIGCALGKPLPFFTSRGIYSENGQLIGIDGGERSPYGYTIIQGLDDGTPFDLRPYFDQEPNDTVCGDPTASSECALVSNPTFTSMPSAWTVRDDGAVWGGNNPPGEAAGLDLSNGAFVSQDLSLDLAHSYFISVQFHTSRIVDGNGRNNFLVGVGDYPGEPDVDFVAHEILADLNVSGVQSVTIPAQSYASFTMAGNIIRLWVRAEPSTLIVDSVCIADEAEGPPLASECILVNPEFDNSAESSGAGWTGYPVIADVEFNSAQGVVNIPDAAEIRQSLTLSPKSGSASQFYEIQFWARRAGAPAAGESVALDWSWNTASGDDLGPLDDTAWTELTDSFEVTTKTTALLHIAADGSDGDQVLSLDRVCIVTLDGAPPPGFQPPPVFAPSCKTCSYMPIGDLATDFSEYVGWINCKFFQLWECQLKTVLYLLLTATTNILTFLGYMRIWALGTLQVLVTWGNANLLVFARWLGGTLHNLGVTFENALTRAISITYVTEGGAGFWDALVALFNAVRDLGTTIVNGLAPLLQQIIDGLFGVVGDLLKFLGSLFNLLVSFVGLALAMLAGTLSNVIGALVTAFNRAAITLPPGAFTCSEPGTTLYYPCLGFYVLDNTIFSGPVVYIFPLFMAIASIRLLIWGAGRIKRAFSW